jgi:phosphatidylglycerol lysyltransferase
MNKAHFEIDEVVSQEGEVAHGGGTFSFSERVEYLKRYGKHSMAFSALQPKMRYFDIEDVGYIAYRKQWGTVVALGDPVCAPEDREQLIEGFYSKYKSAAFIQVTPDVAQLIHEKTGFNATQFGKETLIDLNKWTLSGKKKQVIRTAVNHAKRDGVTVKESYGDMNYRHLSDDWLKTRKCKGREIIFLIRPMEMDYKEGTRRFFAYQNDEIIGFIFFDPVYENGQVVGYVPNISRASEKFPQGIFYSLMVEAMAKFKEEGVPYIYLGLSPLALDYPPKDCESKILRWMLEFTAKHLNFLYNFKGIDFTKSRFRGDEEPTYVLTKSKMATREFVSIFRMCNVI